MDAANVMVNLCINNVKRWAAFKPAMEKTVSTIAEGASQFDLCGNLFLETEAEFDVTSCHALLFVYEFSYNSFGFYFVSKFKRLENFISWQEEFFEVWAEESE